MRLYWKRMAGLAVFTAFLAPPGLAGPPSLDKKIDGKGRFKVLKKFDGKAVLDKETGLVWHRTPGISHSWVGAQGTCVQLVVADRMGWRVPAMNELTSLIDPTQLNPTLPPGHPFGLSPGRVWSANTSANNSASAVTADFNALGHVARTKTQIYRVWCVRGPGGVDGGH